MSCLAHFESSLSPLVAGRQLSFLDFQVVSLIGAGSTGSVYHVVDKVTSRDFAMKIVPTGSENAELALREYFTLRGVAGAPFTITLRGFFADDVNYYLLTDYFPSGDIYAQVDSYGKDDIEPGAVLHRRVDYRPGAHTLQEDHSPRRESH
jgi:serine/threonine protein kinase